jgi:hypothetical protein
VNSPPVVEPPDPSAPHCTRCARSRAESPPEEALAWTMTNDKQARSWLCPQCARTHTRDIEAKLPDEYW